MADIFKHLPRYTVRLSSSSPSFVDFSFFFAAFATALAGLSTLCFVDPIIDNLSFAGSFGIFDESRPQSK